MMVNVVHKQAKEKRAVEDTGKQTEADPNVTVLLPSGRCVLASQI